MKADQIYIGPESETGNWAPVGLLDSSLWQAEVMQAKTTAVVLPVWRAVETPGHGVPVWT